MTAEYVSPGVYVEEVPALAQVSTGTSPSNMGIVGYAPRGPANVATLVTSYEQYTRVFGGLVTESYMPLSVAAFFANGGQRAYVVRVPPADAVTADAKIQSKVYGVTVAVGNGAEDEFTGTLDVAEGTAPLVPGTVQFKWRAAGTPVVADPAVAADGTTALTLIEAQADYTGRVATSSLPAFDAELDSVVRGTVHVKFTVDAVGAVDIAVPVGTASSVEASVGAGVNVAQVMFDHQTGIFSLHLSGTYVPAATDASNAITLDFTPTTSNLVANDARGRIVVVPGGALLDGDTFSITHNGVTKTFEFDNDGTTTADVVIPFIGSASLAEIQAAVVAAVNQVSDVLLLEAVADGTSGVRLLPLTGELYSVSLSETVSDAGFSVAPATASTLGLYLGDVAAGTLNYATGEYSFTAATAPGVKCGVVASYTRNAWDLDPSSVGVWGNNLRVQVTGSPNYFTPETGSYSHFDVIVALRDVNTGLYSVVEQFEELVFDDSSSPVFFADVLNELSDYVSVAEPSSNVAPTQLSSVMHSQVLGGGEAQPAAETSAYRQTFEVTLAEAPIQPRTVVITYTDETGETRTISDDGTGFLVGSVSAIGTNTIDYTTGALDFTAQLQIKGGTLVTAVYGSAVEEIAHVEDFGDTSKNYTVGAEGTFASPHWSRTQFTDPALQADYKGLYALDRVDDLMQVVVPDFAGNLTVTRDLLNYADGRAAQPAGGDRFIILTTPSGYTAAQARDWFRFSLRQYSNYAALYWPWVRVADPLSNNRPKLMPPLAHIAGVYARTDANQNVGKSPGGTVDGALRYLTGLELNPTQADRDLVYPNKVNPLVNTAQTGLAVWGVRTISNQVEWKFINARRLFMYVEKMVYQSTWWSVFENNGPALWTRLSAQVSGFLNNLFLQGYFAGTTASQAFFVKCDGENNTPASLEAGQVIVDIGIAPNKPAEFIRLRFQQKALTT